MSELWLPAGIVVASLAMTYFCCMRPMRKGHCGPAATHPESELSPSSNPEIQDDETRSGTRDLDRMASRDDRMISIAEWLLFGDGRQWAGNQVTGRVL